MRSLRASLVVAVSLLAFTSLAAAQEKAAPMKSHMQKAEMSDAAYTAQALSAAPKSIAKDATVVRMDKDGKMKGTITKVDAAQKMMTVKDKAGKEWTIYWNADTKVEGDGPKEGAKVRFKATEKDGKMWATWVKTGEAKTKM